MLVMTSLKNHPTPVASHAIADVQKRLRGWAKFFLNPLNSPSTTHTVLYSTFYQPHLIIWQAVHIKASRIS
jgi:hypothetical protein